MGVEKCDQNTSNCKCSFAASWLVAREAGRTSICSFLQGIDDQHLLAWCIHTYLYLYLLVAPWAASPMQAQKTADEVCVDLHYRGAEESRALRTALDLIWIL
jgi:hypothetical protein